MRRYIRLEVTRICDFVDMDRIAYLRNLVDTRIDRVFGGIGSRNFAQPHPRQFAPPMRGKVRIAGAPSTPQRNGMAISPGNRLFREKTAQRVVSPVRNEEVIGY